MGDFVTGHCTDRSCTNDTVPCLNNGLCINTTNISISNNYMCSCSSNYFGSSCQYYNECSTSPCINNGTCMVNINTVTVHQYTCTCTEGWSGSECHIPVCTSYTCSNGGTCTVSGITLVCTCTDGYTGSTCDISL